MSVDRVVGLRSCCEEAEGNRGQGVKNRKTTIKGAEIETDAPTDT